MKPVLRAAALYFAAVFAAGFVFAIVRVLWLVPDIGARAAELLETPLMLAVMVIAARAIVRRLALAPALGARLAMGLVALAMMLAAEFGLVLWLTGISLSRYFANLDPVTATAYYGALVIFAVVPLFVPPAIARARRQRRSDVSHLRRLPGPLRADRAGGARDCRASPRAGDRRARNR